MKILRQKIIQTTQYQQNIDSFWRYVFLHQMKTTTLSQTLKVFKVCISLGVSLFIGPSRGSVNKFILHVSKAIITRLSHLIGWPKDEDSNRRIAQQFAQRSKPN